MGMHDVKTPPRTIMEVFKGLPEGTLAEIIDGKLYMSPSPTTDHQSILLALAFGIHEHVKSANAGKVYFAPLDVYLDEHSNAVQPDIIFISTLNNSIIKADAIHGVPDLLMEILSPGNEKHDTVRKKHLYEKFGVQEYWIISPDTKKAEGFVLQGGKYVSVGPYMGKINSAMLDNTAFEF